ncbi:MAG: hypothetical protein A2Y66_00165 [Nitrospirae bacterium RBG_13_41_22]|nr:MAG: hypothetical protein A2Y66_00165 [Nitrospirae bacterium RBG_13_41_22]
MNHFSKEEVIMKKSVVTCFCLISVVALSLFFLNSPLYAVSGNVAVIDSLNGDENGGAYPTTTSGPTGNFTAFTFTTMPVANINAANLGAYDTVLLNMQSSGINCDSNSLTASQKTDLVNFVSAGGKLIIYDSECSAVDYSWVPYPFTTNNPGATGATGTLSVVENTDLASSVTSSPKFIDASLMATGTDAVGDMNVMVTRDAHWCLSMSGTNVNAVKGPVQTYAALGSGLIIWNGLDIDYMDTSTSPDSSDAEGNIAKVWLQELQATGATLPTSTCTPVVPVQPPQNVPTMTEWGLIIFMFLAGLGSIYYLKRQKRVEK